MPNDDAMLSTIRGGGKVSRMGEKTTIAEALAKYQ